MTSPAAVRGIFFTVRDPVARQLAAWRYDTDSRIIRAHLNKRGFALVNNLLTGRHMERITEMPEPGTATPHIGMTGGGFSYHFFVREGRAEIEARCFSTGFPPVEVTDLEPFHAQLPESPYWQMPFRPGFEIAYPEETLRRQGEYLFGFWGSFSKTFHDWGWYSEDLENYEFEFVPTSVGCLLSIRHLASGNVLDLTRNIDW